MSPSRDVFSLTRHNRYDELKRLLAADASFDVDVRDAKGNTLLLVACQNGLKRIAKLMLKHGADVNAQNDAGNTALHFAFMYGFGESLGTLLREQGSDESIVNAKGMVPEAAKLGSQGSVLLPRLGHAESADYDALGDAYAPDSGWEN